jgi:uncharacterized protein (UPF0261 family)
VQADGTAKGPTTFLLPKGGCHEWDRPGADLNDPDGLAAFCDEMEKACPDNVDLKALACHINDAEFCDDRAGDLRRMGRGKGS